MNIAVLQEPEPTAVLQEPKPTCVTSTKDNCDLDDTCQVQDLTCSSDKCSERQVMLPDTEISVETQRGLILDFMMVLGA